MVVDRAAAVTALLVIALAGCSSPSGVTEAGSSAPAPTQSSELIPGAGPTPGPQDSGAPSAGGPIGEGGTAPEVPRPADEPYVPPGDPDSPYRTILGHNDANYINAYPPSGADRRSLDGVEFQSADGTVQCGIFTFFSGPDPFVQCWVQGGVTIDGQRCRDLQMSTYSLEHYATGVYCNTQFTGATNSTVYAGPDRGYPPGALAAGESVTWAGAVCEAVSTSMVRCSFDADHGFEASTSGVTLS